MTLKQEYKDTPCIYCGAKKLIYKKKPREPLWTHSEWVWCERCNRYMLEWQIKG